MKSEQRPRSEAASLGKIFDTAHQSAVQANQAAGEDRSIRQVLVEKQQEAQEMDAYLPRQQMYVFTCMLLAAGIAECLASWEFYKIFLKGSWQLAGIKFPHALLAAMVVVSFGVMLSHLLRTLNSTIVRYELAKAEASSDGTPFAALNRQLKQTRRIQHLLGFLGLIGLSCILLAFSDVRVFWEAKSAGHDIPFTPLDASPVVFLWAEVWFGIYCLYALRRLSLSYSIWRLSRASAHCRRICQEHTHLLAAAVFDLDRQGFDWQANNEIRIAMLRYEHRNSAQEDYTDAINLGKTNVIVRDKRGNGVQAAQITGLTNSEMLTAATITGINGDALLNYMADGLKAIFVNGQAFEGNFPSGTTAVLVIEKNRPIGF